MYTLRVYREGTFLPAAELAAISELRSHPATIIWLDLEAPTEHEAALLSDEFGFHPLAIEDAVRDHERPKVDAYEDYYLFVFYSSDYQHSSGEADGPARRRSQVDLRQLNVFVGKNYLVTIHRRPITPVAEAMQRWQAPRGPIHHEVGSLLHDLLDAIVDDYFTTIDQLVDAVEDLEDRIFSRFREGAIEEIFSLKKDLLLLRRVVAPERDVLNVLLRQQLPIFAPGTLIYVQDVYDHLVKVTETVDLYRDLLSSALDSYLSLQSNQLNQLVKTLTLASIMLMSASLISGVYGMNFVHMPELAWPWGYPFALALMLTVGLGLALFFKSRRWW